MLDRIRINRVFDFPGAAKALSEFNAMLEQNDRGTEETPHKDEHGRGRSIADSEDEVVDDLPAELESTSPPVPGTTRHGTCSPKTSFSSMIVLDNIANVLESMMTKSQVQDNTCM